MKLKVLAVIFVLIAQSANSVATNLNKISIWLQNMEENIYENIKDIHKLEKQKTYNIYRRKQENIEENIENRLKHRLEQRKQIKTSDTPFINDTMFIHPYFSNVNDI